MDLSILPSFSDTRPGNQIANAGTARNQKETSVSKFHPSTIEKKANATVSPAGTIIVPFNLSMVFRSSMLIKDTKTNLVNPKIRKSCSYINGTSSTPLGFRKNELITFCAILFSFAGFTNALADSSPVMDASGPM